MRDFQGEKSMFFCQWPKKVVCQNLVKEFKEEYLWLEVSIPLRKGVTGVDRLHTDTQTSRLKDWIGPESRLSEK